MAYPFKTKLHLNFESLRGSFSEILKKIPDSRQKNKINYDIHDTMMSGFACMYFQDPSLLQFQQRLEEYEQRSNLHTIFGVHHIPSETQMREVIDAVDSHYLNPVFENYFYQLQRGKHLQQYQLFENLYLCPIDGTQYFSSNNIHCQQCLTAQHKKENITYSHKVLQAGIMHPELRQVIPFMPEEICNGDGYEKQDCEVNAAKRLIPKLRKSHPQLGLIITGDGLFSKQPMIEHVLKNNMHYIFVAKPSDHTYLTEWLDAYPALHEYSTEDEKGTRYVYEWMNEVPLNAADENFRVNFFRFKLIKMDKQGKEKITYQNSWVTDLTVTQHNIVTLVRGGRCRWKIENECFNTLKNQGYNIEHNYGHGQKNLCFNFYLLTLLAFFFHQIFELTDKLYQASRKKFGSKTHMWESLRSYIKILIFDSWYHLLDFAFTPTKYQPVLSQAP